MPPRVYRRAGWPPFALAGLPYGWPHHETRGGGADGRAQKSLGFVLNLICIHSVPAEQLEPGSQGVLEGRPSLESRSRCTTVSIFRPEN